MYEISDIVSGKVKVKELESSVNALNKLFDGSAYNSDEMFIVYSKPNVGKTLLLVQEAFWFSSKGYNVLYIDTEGGLHQFIKKWASIFESRFGARKGKIYVESRKGLERLFEFMGYKVTVECKGKGKTEFRVLEKMDRSPIDDVILDRKIDVVMLDSATMPIREFTLEQQSHPAKDSAMSLLLIKLAKVMDEHNAIVIITNHASDNPANPYERGAEVRGGRIVKHMGKRIVYIDSREKKGLENYRRFWLVRAEDVEKWSRATGAKITDFGYEDITEEEMKEIFTKAEVDRLDTRNT